MNATSLRVLTPAKVNLILRVLERRPDGFHAIWSLMHTVGLDDEVLLTLQPSAASRIVLRCDHAALGADQSNLVYRAAQLVLARIDRPVDLSIVLTKRIPLGAGLGGGSSDAAATILGLTRLLGVNWSVQQMAHAGITRGGHYHHTKTEKFLVIRGQARFCFRHLLTNETYEVLTQGGDGRVVETIPGWVHDITNIGTDELIVMLWANEIFDRAQPDTVAARVI